MELPDDGENSRWHFKVDDPQERSVDGVISFGEVENVYAQRGVLPGQLLQASYYGHHDGERAPRSKATAFLRQERFSFGSTRSH